MSTIIIIMMMNTMCEVDPGCLFDFQVCVRLALRLVFNTVLAMPRFLVVNTENKAVKEHPSLPHSTPPPAVYAEKRLTV